MYGSPLATRGLLLLSLSISDVWESMRQCYASASCSKTGSLAEISLSQGWVGLYNTYKYGNFWLPLFKIATFAWIYVPIWISTLAPFIVISTNAISLFNLIKDKIKARRTMKSDTVPRMLFILISQRWAHAGRTVGEYDCLTLGTKLAGKFYFDLYLQ